jgi:hypothetical protein
MNAHAGADADVVDRFERFIDREVRESSPLYALLAQHVADSVAEGGLFEGVLAAAPERQRIPNLLFAAVQRVLFDEPEDDLAAYYPSLGGHRAPDDDELPRAFDAFVAAHRERIEALLSTGETQTNEVLRAAPLFPAFGWAQACTRRPLGLIEAGSSAGLLLHADRYAYVYEFEDGSELPAGSGEAHGVPKLRSKAEGEPAAAAKTLEPFVSKELRVASRVGLDINPLSPEDPEHVAWLRALVWPEHTERRERLEAALAHAARRPVRLRKGDALRILPDAVDSVPRNAIPCVFVSNTIPHWSREGRGAFAELIRGLGAHRDLVCVMKEGYQAGLGLFTGRPDDHAPEGAPAFEVLAAAVYLGGQERLFRLGNVRMHGVGLEWSPVPVAL